ncbi:putative methyltransferase nsun7 [Lobulomyces angularis]|nr:putative methyltransferase nsun7 [Lobulomyces angularis]
MEKSNLRQYHSDTSLIPATTSPSTNNSKKLGKKFFPSQSEPTLSISKKCHPLIGDYENESPPTCNELFYAAETLENIVQEGSLMGTAINKFRGIGLSDSSTREISDRILSIVYGTMKYLPYIDLILVKTQFLVYHTEFLGSLGLVKVMLYSLMRNNFEYQNYHCANFEENCTSILSKQELARRREIEELDQALRSHKVKLSAAFARIRIARQACGKTSKEKLEGILPEDVREKESIAVEMAKTLRINTARTSLEEVISEFQKYNFKFVPEPLNLNNEVTKNTMYLDQDFPELIQVPSVIFAELKSKPFVTEGKLIFQDKASLYPVKHFISQIKGHLGTIVDARAGCGTRLSFLSNFIKSYANSNLKSKNGENKPFKLIAFESRPARFESLKSRLKIQNVLNVASNEEIKIFDTNFISCDVRDPIFSNVKTIFVEPPSSGTAVIDKLGYLLQEEEFPNQNHSAKDFVVFKKQQINFLKHAFLFPNVEHIIYSTRSTRQEENEQVVEDIMNRFGVEWELNCVMPDMTQNLEDHEYEECLALKPTESGNGIFIAHFQKIASEVEVAVQPAEINQNEEAFVAPTEMEPAVKTTLRKSKKSLRRKKVSRNEETMSTSSDDNLTAESETELNQKEENSVQIKSKVKQKLQPNDRRRLRLTDAQRKLINRLTIKTKTLKKKKIGSKLQVNKRSKENFQNDNDGNNSEDDTSEEEDEEIAQNDKRDSINESKLSLFGAGLKRFYAPNYAAVKQIHQEKYIEDLKTGKAWRYPVRLKEKNL